MTPVPSPRGAEDLLIVKPRGSFLVVWVAEEAGLDAFLDGMPFRAPLDESLHMLSASGKGKLEILERPCRRSRFIVLDDPTFVRHRERRMRSSALSPG